MPVGDQHLACVQEFAILHGNEIEDVVVVVVRVRAKNLQALLHCEVWSSNQNRIRELGQQFGIPRLCVQKFWGTEAMHHLAIAAYNLCVLLQRRLGQLEKCELNTLRWRLFGCAAVWSLARGKPTLKLAVQKQPQRGWWREILDKLTALPNCNAVESLQA